MRVKVWSLARFVRNITIRQQNELDVNVAITGATGSGKSTLAGKIMFRFPVFDAWKHLVYKRRDVIDLIQNQTLGVCWDDEAINSSYKRQFQDKEQQELIKTLAMYRNQKNLYLAVLPEFFSLDKDVRDYYAIHIFVIRRGLAVVLRRDSSSIFLSDRWHTKYNQKLEESWQRKKAKNPNFEIPYHNLKGFVCYIKYNDLTTNQRALIEEIKKTKRAEVMNHDDNKEKAWIDKVYDLMLDGKLNKSGLQQMCLLEGKKYSSVCVNLNRILNDRGEKRTLKNFMNMDEINEEDAKKKIHSIVPDV